MKDILGAFSIIIFNIKSLNSIDCPLGCSDVLAVKEEPAPGPCPPGAPLHIGAQMHPQANNPILQCGRWGDMPPGPIQGTQGRTCCPVAESLTSKVMAFPWLCGAQHSTTQGHVDPEPTGWAEAL